MMTDIPEDDLILAAEYAMGLLEGDERLRTAARARDDAAFAQIVTQWERQLAGLTDTLEDVAPARASKQAVMQRLFPEPAKPGLFQRLWLWQGVSLAAILVAAFFIATDVAQTPTQDRPLYSADIQSAEGDFRVIAVVDTASEEVILTLLDGGAPEGRVLEVWAAGPGQGVQSVGIWPGGDNIRLPLPPQVVSAGGVLTLAVSEEPAGGSPTGAPTGRIFGLVEISLDDEVI